MADTAETVVYDAVLVPKFYPPGKDGWARNHALRNEFGPLLGSNLVMVQHSGFHHSLLRAKHAHDEQGHYFEKEHELTGESRYLWTERDQKDGVMLGTLRPEAKANAAS